MNTVRWGIIGCGNVTEVKSGPGLYLAPDSAVVAVMRRDAAKARDYARRHHVPKWYTDADALIDDLHVDAVYVATPPGTHEHYAMKVLAAGKPCYVEKPMARNESEAARMVEAFRLKAMPLFVAYYRRALPRFLKARELIDAGELGRIHTVSHRYSDGKMLKREKPVPWRMLAEESGGGLFMDLAPHVLDMLDFWFGPLKVVSRQAANERRAYAVEDHVWGTLAAGPNRNISISVDCHFATPGKTVDEFVITGQFGEIRLSCFGNDMVRFKSADGRWNIFDLPNPPHVAQPLIETVVNDLLGRGTCPSTGESALRTQEVMDRMLEGYYGGREDGFWQREWPVTRASSPTSAERPFPNP
jgi:1,5-anhydro-D-fructose reductase (1,5-anhydro-D-mannitol-forming)